MNFNSCKAIYEKHNLKSIKHIKLLSNEFHPSTILKTVDFCISARGTSGAEYGAFGVPCITTDYAPYNYCSFNYNFKKKSHYFSQLIELPEIPISDNSKYKTDAYNYLNLSFNKTKCPNPYFANNKYLPKNMSISEESKYLKKCADLIAKSNIKDKVYFNNLYKKYIENNKYVMFRD